MNELKEPQIWTGLYTFVSGYVDVHKEGTGHPSPFLGGREREVAQLVPSSLTNLLLGQYYRHFRVFGCTCFVHIPAQLIEGPQGNHLCLSLICSVRV